MHGEPDDPLMQGLAALLARNIAGELHRRAPIDDPDLDTPHESPVRGGSAPRPSPSPGTEPELELPRPGLVLDGKRELVRYIGSGSFGTVYEARQLDLDRVEAIKFLHERWMTSAHHEVRARFLEEARVMARMRGPHLVEVYDCGTLAGGLPYLVMERLQGRTLRARLYEQGELTLPEFFDIAPQILQGLCEAHAHDVVHRDVKPENIFLASEGVKLLDFGLAKTSVAMTASDALMGTPLYMAPELVTGERSDARTDLYAAAAVLYEMLTGNAPFWQPGIDRRELERAMAHESPVPPSARRDGIPHELDALIGAGLAKRQDDRPSNAREMLDRLLAIRERWLEAERGNARVDEDESPATSPTAAPSEVVTSERASRRWWRWALAVLGLVLLAYLGASGRDQVVESPMLETQQTFDEGEAPLVGEQSDPELRRAYGGLLVTRSHSGGPDVQRIHSALCHALGGDRARSPDAVVDLPVHCATQPSSGASPSRLEALSNAVGAKAVVHVDEGFVRLHLLDRSRRLPLLAALPVLELPVDAEIVERIAPVLEALLAPNASDVVEVPVLDPGRDGLYWATLAEALRHYHGQRDPFAIERLERLARCTVHRAGEPQAVYCNLARLLHALELPCDRAVAPLREIILADSREGGVLGQALRVELARCLASHGTDESVVEAERLIENVLSAHGDPCARASLMSTVAVVAQRGGDRSGALQSRMPSEPAELGARCGRVMLVRELTARANVYAEQARWCEAAKDDGDAYQLQPRSVAAVLNWAEASLQCPEAGVVLDALEPQRFERGPPRASVAFMRWLVTRKLADAQGVLASYDEVPLNVVPLLDGTASGLPLPTRCPGAAQPCAYELLQRPKEAEHRPMLRGSLGLEDEPTPP